jgi:hypothetical protein
MPAPATAEIILVRHGPSAHVERAWLDADGVRRWMIAYDAAEIALHHPPPPARWLWAYWRGTALPGVDPSTPGAPGGWSGDCIYFFLRTSQVGLPHQNLR